MAQSWWNVHLSVSDFPMQGLIRSFKCKVCVQYFYKKCVVASEVIVIHTRHSSSYLGWIFFMLWMFWDQTFTHYLSIFLCPKWSLLVDMFPSCCYEKHTYCRTIKAKTESGCITLTPSRNNQKINPYIWAWRYGANKNATLVDCLQIRCNTEFNRCFPRCARFK